ncbi:MAG TPA: hypothetical protein VGJ94_06825 [Syntrophorhabdaceae bacterium]|jgi:outer membrane murein-binding lipoprotein Lpp
MKRILFLAAAIIVTCASLSGCFSYTSKESKETTIERYDTDDRRPADEKP